MNLFSPTWEAMGENFERYYSDDSFIQHRTPNQIHHILPHAKLTKTQFCTFFQLYFERHDRNKAFEAMQHASLNDSLSLSEALNILESTSKILNLPFIEQIISIIKSVSLQNCPGNAEQKNNINSNHQFSFFKPQDITIYNDLSDYILDLTEENEEEDYQNSDADEDIPEIPWPNSRRQQFIPQFPPLPTNENSNENETKQTQSVIRPKYRKQLFTSSDDDDASWDNPEVNWRIFHENSGLPNPFTKQKEGALNMLSQQTNNENKFNYDISKIPGFDDFLEESRKKLIREIRPKTEGEQNSQKSNKMPNLDEPIPMFYGPNNYPMPPMDEKAFNQENKKMMQPVQKKSANKRKIHSDHAKRFQQAIKNVNKKFIERQEQWANKMAAEADKLKRKYKRPSSSSDD